jgi:hypothetical protein
MKLLISIPPIRLCPFLILFSPLQAAVSARYQPNSWGCEFALFSVPGLVFVERVVVEG